MPINDKDMDLREPPDVHGRVALLLVESLIHGLTERSILSLGDAIDIVDTAVAVQADVADAADGAGPAMQDGVALLEAIADSLRQDGVGSDGHSRYMDGDGGR